MLVIRLMALCSAQVLPSHPAREVSCLGKGLGCLHLWLGFVGDSLSCVLSGIALGGWPRLSVPTVVAC